MKDLFEISWCSLLGRIPWTGHDHTPVHESRLCVGKGSKLAILELQSGSLEVIKVKTCVK